MIYRFQEQVTAVRMIEYEADSYDEAFEKWADGITPLDESEWDLDDDNEIFLDDVVEGQLK